MTLLRSNFLLDQEVPQHFPKPSLHQKKVMVTVWWSAVVWSTTAFWIPGKPLHMRSMLSKSMRRTANCSTCSWHWSTERSDSPRQCPTSHCTTHTSKAERIELQSSASSTTFPWPLANRLPLQASWQLFAGKTLPQLAGGRRCFPRIRRILKHECLCYRNKFVSHWQKCFDCNGSYFD